MRIGVMLRTMGEKFGIGVFTQNLMPALLALDPVNEYVLFYYSEADAGRFAQRPNVREVVVRAPNKAVWDQVAIPMAAARAGVDIIYHTKFTVPFLTFAKTVMVIHGASWFTHPEVYINKVDLVYIRMMTGLYCRRADAIISNSQLTTDDYARILKVPRDKMFTVPYAADARFRRVTDSAALADVRARCRLPERYVLTVSRYDPRKNIPTIIEAYACSMARSRGVKLLVVGKDSDRYAVECRISERGLADDVLFPGYMEQVDLPAVYSLADAFLFPSIYEEFGIPLCEAMGCGCPIVGANAGAIPEITGGAAVLEAPFDAVAMGRAIDRILTEPAFRNDLVERGLQRAKFFTYERCAAQTLEVLERVGGRVGVPSRRRAAT
jgi:glycosyltransferase involved in cell wall biosynthesis